MDSTVGESDQDVPRVPRRSGRSGRSGCSCVAALVGVLSVPVVLVSVPLVLLAMRASPPDTVTPSRDAIVGSWRSEDGATLTFSADGTVVAANMPAGTEPAVDPGAVAVDKPELPWGSGRWDVRAASGSKFGGVDAWMSSGEVELETRGDASHPTLFALIGDPDADDEYVFTKF